MGAKRTNPFHYQKFGLNSITVYRNGYPIAGTPLESENDKKIYLNSLEALAFEQHGHGIPFADYSNHYLMVFDLTSTQQASHDYLHPELTNASISISLRFSQRLQTTLKFFFWAERASTIYIDSARKCPRTWFLNTQIDARK